MGNSDYGGPPTDNGYVNVFSNQKLCSIKSDGSITAWGRSDYGGSNAPTDGSYTYCL